jgi:drug/metabolite transporter (DMT)-like permease
MKKLFPGLNTKVFLAFAVIYIIWGTTYLAIRFGLESMQPFIMAAIRYIIAGGLLLLFRSIKGEAIFMFPQGLSNPVNYSRNLPYDPILCPASY